MTSTQYDQIVFNTILWFIFGIGLIIYARRILTSPEKVVPWPYWVMIQISGILKGKEGKDRKRKELLTPQKLRKNAIFALTVGILLLLASILGFIAAILANNR